MAEVEVAVVLVAAPNTWDCEECGRADVVAYVADPDDDMTFGYCRDCLGAAVLQTLSNIASERREDA